MREALALGGSTGGGIEPAGVERQCHGVALEECRASRTRPAAREGELRLGRIDTLHLSRRATLDKQLGERPVAATHVDPALTRSG
jgi:hypothetical protein